MNRRKSREIATQLLFEMSINKEDYSFIIHNFKENSDLELQDIDFQYIERILRGFQVNGKEIDSTIEKYLVKWKLERLPKMNLAILRMATCEILFEEDIPERVSVNEAIELAKTYGDDNAPSFINAVLNNLVKK
ncbi:transcription antitermination factor NusB [Clostridium sp. UBA4548]|uniref:transcription antitermination factor NusB n=1 Tax=Clostridium sp. UBA4548 TaxID=1946361 RepID=UPI0025BF5905|nr:transcription antitermination factor NusB [Clostridium sp. UBA4548]